MADDTVDPSVDPFASAVSVDDPSAPKEPTLTPDAPVARVLPEETPKEEKPKVEPETPAEGAETPEAEKPEEKPVEHATAEEVKKLREELEATRDFARKSQAAKDRAEQALKQITPAEEKSFRERLEAQYPIINDEDVFQKRADEIGFFKALKERDTAKALVADQVEAAKESVRNQAALQVRQEQAGDAAMAYGAKAGLNKEQIGKIFKIYGSWANQTPEEALESAKAAIDLHAPSLVNKESAETLARTTETKIRKNLAKSVPAGGLGAGSEPADSEDWRKAHLAELSKAFAPDVGDPFANARSS